MKKAMYAPWACCDTKEGGSTLVSEIDTSFVTNCGWYSWKILFYSKKPPLNNIPSQFSKIVLGLLRNTFEHSSSSFKNILSPILSVSSVWRDGITRLCLGDKPQDARLPGVYSRQGSGTTALINRHVQSWLWHVTNKWRPNFRSP